MITGKLAPADALRRQVAQPLYAAGAAVSLTFNGREQKLMRATPSTSGGASMVHVPRSQFVVGTGAPCAARLVHAQRGESPTRADRSSK